MRFRGIVISVLVCLLALCLFGCEKKPVYPKEGSYFYKVEDGSATIMDVDPEISGDVVIPDTLGGCPVIAIGEYAFEDCSYITSVTIPDSVLSIEYCAFGYCTYLEDVHIGTGLIEMESGAFWGCESLQNVYIRDLAAWCQVEGSGSGPLDEAENLYLNGELLTDVVIPDGVAFIGSFAFSGYKKLASISIPDSVVELRSSAFYECENLKEITLPESITHIWNSVFYYCTGLTEITIPSGVTVLRSGVFQGCEDLVSVTLPEGLTEIGTYAFYGCSSLKEIAIPNGVREIGMYAFYDCRSLTEIVLPDYLQIIPMNTFEKCLQLNKIVLPKGLCVVEEYAFTDCKKLATVYHKGTAEDWNAIRFENGNDLIQNAAVQHNYDNGNPVPSDAPVGPADPNFAWPEGAEEKTVWEKIVDVFVTIVAGIFFIILAPILLIFSTIMAIVHIFI